MHSQEILIPIEEDHLEGTLGFPEKDPGRMKGLVLFVHGSGSSRKSPRNQLVAQHLLSQGIGTLLFDLLTKEEEANHDNAFNLELLVNRLLMAISWVLEQKDLKDVPLGLFGASTGAAAALIAEYQSHAQYQRHQKRPFAGDTDASDTTGTSGTSGTGSDESFIKRIKAIVSRGGRPDLAMKILPHIKTPTLLIVGGVDTEVLELNQAAFNELTCEKGLEVIPGAGHLFEEPNALEEVMKLSHKWFEVHFQRA